MTAKINFTKRTLEALPTPRTKRATYYDRNTRGLGLLVQPSGHRSFFWFRKVNGHPTWHTIGPFPDLSVDEARGAADEANSKLARGESPWKNGNPVTVGDTFAEYIEKYLKAHAKNPERAAAAAESHLQLHLAPWRDRRLDAITRADVRDLHAKIGERRGSYAANRMLQTLRAAINFALDQELWKGENPAAGIKLNREPQRTRFLQPTEFPRFFKELEAERNVDLRDCIWIALFAGQRRGNLLAMRWIELDLVRGLWTIPDPKNRQPQVAVLVPKVVVILRDRRRWIPQDCPWVFPGASKTGHLVELKSAWQKFRSRAKVDDLRFHDLRRTLGSWQAGSGASLQIIGKSLGHRSVGATAIYSQLILDPVRASVETATRAMLTAGKVRK